MFLIRSGKVEKTPGNPKIPPAFLKLVKSDYSVISSTEILSTQAVPVQ